MGKWRSDLPLNGPRRRRMAALRRGMHVLERRTFEAEIPAACSRWAVSLIE